jgi:type II secretory pathway pseudopilin PulG
MRRKLSCPNTTNRRRGFTLVDLLTAMVIISFVFLAFTELMMLSVRTNKKADYEFVAAGVAERKIQAIRMQSFSALTNGTTTETVTELPGGQIQTQIGAVTGLVTNSMKQVQIVVTWNSVGTQRTTGGRIRLDTLISQSR